MVEISEDSHQLGAGKGQKRLREMRVEPGKLRTDHYDVGDAAKVARTSRIQSMRIILSFHETEKINKSPRWPHWIPLRSYHNYISS